MKVAQITLEEALDLAEESFNPYKVGDKKAAAEDFEIRRTVRQACAIEAFSKHLASKFPNLDEVFHLNREHGVEGDGEICRMITVMLYQPEMLDVRLFRNLQLIVTAFPADFAVEVMPELDGVVPDFDLFLYRDKVVFWAADKAREKMMLDAFSAWTPKFPRRAAVRKPRSKPKAARRKP